MSPVKYRFTLNRPGVAELAKSEWLAQHVTEAAEAIGHNVDAQGREAQSPDYQGDTRLRGLVRVYTTDRARASVTIPHPAALAIEAKHGVLTQAVAATGLQLHPPKRSNATGA